MTHVTAAAEIYLDGAAPAWVERYYNVVDAMNYDEFVALHTEDATLRFGNAEPAIGRTALTEGIQEFWKSIHGIRHNFQRVWDIADSAVVEALIEYARHDGTVITLPCTSILHRRGDRIQDLRIYMDIAPVYS